MGLSPSALHGTVIGPSLAATFYRHICRAMPCEIPRAGKVFACRLCRSVPAVDRWQRHHGRQKARADRQTICVLPSRVHADAVHNHSRSVLCPIRKTQGAPNCPILTQERRASHLTCAGSCVQKSLTHTRSDAASGFRIMGDKSSLYTSSSSTLPSTT